MVKKRVVVVCPGRGSYSRESSNYLSESRPYIDKHIISFDKKREAQSLIKLSELDNSH